MLVQLRQLVKALAFLLLFFALDGQFSRQDASIGSHVLRVTCVVFTNLVIAFGCIQSNHFSFFTAAAVIVIVISIVVVIIIAQPALLPPLGRRPVQYLANGLERREDRFNRRIGL
jgi:hypothetical protein